MEEKEKILTETKDWANPTPAGLVALAVAGFGFFAFLNGHVDQALAMPLLGCWLIGGFVVQIIVGVIDLKGGNQTGGDTFLFFSAFFMLATGMLMFVKYFAEIEYSVLDGFVWLALTGVLILWLPAFCKPFGLLSLIVIAVVIAAPVIAFVDLGWIDAGFVHIAGYALLAAGILAIYYSAAIIVNSVYGREVYPLLRLGKN
jgi:succinate-acetate transporter protein